MRKFTAETIIDKQINGTIILPIFECPTLLTAVEEARTMLCVTVLNDILNFIKDETKISNYAEFDITINQIEKGYTYITVTVAKFNELISCHGSKELLLKAVDGFYIKEITAVLLTDGKLEIKFRNY